MTDHEMRLRHVGGGGTGWLLWDVSAGETFCNLTEENAIGLLVLVGFDEEDARGVLPREDGDGVAIEREMAAGYVQAQIEKAVELAEAKLEEDEADAPADTPAPPKPMRTLAEARETFLFEPAPDDFYPGAQAGWVEGETKAGEVFSLTCGAGLESPWIQAVIGGRRWRLHVARLLELVVLQDGEREGEDMEAEEGE